jgi:hypothetical protein
MENSRYQYEITGDKVVLLDKETEGTLKLRFKPVDVKEGSNLMYGTLNDILTNLNKGKLRLTLEGYSIITVNRDVDLRGDVTLRSSYLSDCVIHDSELRYVSMSPYTEIVNTKLSHIGRTGFGKVSFNNCHVDKDHKLPLPNRRYVSVVNNVIVYTS